MMMMMLVMVSVANMTVIFSNRSHERLISNVDWEDNLPVYKMDTKVIADSLCFQNDVAERIF